MSQLVKICQGCWKESLKKSNCLVWEWFVEKEQRYHPSASQHFTDVSLLGGTNLPLMSVKFEEGHLHSLKTWFFRLWYRFLEPKFKNFFRLFKFFFQTQGYQIGRWSKETVKKKGTKLFRDPLQMYGWHWIRFNHNEKNFNYKALVIALKKKIRTFYHFSRLYLHFPDFSLV